MRVDDVKYPEIFHQMFSEILSCFTTALDHTLLPWLRTCWSLNRNGKFSTPDFAPSDFDLFQPMQNHISGVRFKNNVETQD